MSGKSERKIFMQNASLTVGEKRRNEAARHAGAHRKAGRPNPKGLGAQTTNEGPRTGRAFTITSHQGGGGIAAGSGGTAGASSIAAIASRRINSANSRSSVHIGAVAVSGARAARLTPVLSVMHGAHSFPHGNPRSDSSGARSFGQHSSSTSPGNAAAIAHRFVEATKSSVKKTARMARRGRMNEGLSSRTLVFSQPRGLGGRFLGKDARGCIIPAARGSAATFPARWRRR